MSAYEPNSRHLREVLIFCFNMKKSAAEAHRMLSNTYGEATIREKTRREWFQRFKNGDFDVEDQHGIWWDQLGCQERLNKNPTLQTSSPCQEDDLKPQLCINPTHLVITRFRLVFSREMSVTK
ncbi:solute carrier family 23 member 1 [Trichonephila clavipes]|nr:solute carrier family 23 member 1 [Trichonephila clavipes]